MQLQVADWLTNLLGVQSVSGFGASPPIYVQRELDQYHAVLGDCEQFLSVSDGKLSPSAISVKNNLAVIPEEWTNRGVGAFDTI